MYAILGFLVRHRLDVRVATNIGADDAKAISGMVFGFCLGFVYFVLQPTVAFWLNGHQAKEVAHDWNNPYY